MKKRLILFAVTLIFVGCSKSGSAGPQTAAEAETKFDPCENLRQLNPHCGWNPHWDDTGVLTNAIDGSKTEFLSLDSSDADGIAFGRLTYAELRICFENGKLCGHNTVGVGVTVHGVVRPISSESNYSTSVRLKFDDEKPIRQTWGIADSHDALFPSGREKEFLAQILQHKKLALEFSYYENAPQTLTFDLSGLKGKMKSIGLDFMAQVVAEESAHRAKNAALGKKIAQQIGHCKNTKFPNDFCWEPDDGSGPWGSFPTREIAMKYAMEHYKDHSAVH
jgi:hypothetical protein